MPSRADYQYRIRSYQGGNVLIIVDLDMGNTSVTNDAENVLMEIMDAENCDLEKLYIIYRDSTGVYDRLHWKNGMVSFGFIGEEDEEKAIRKVLSL